MKISGLTLKKHSVIPGFGVTLGFTLFYLGLIVLIPLAGLVFRTMEMSWLDFVQTVTDARVLEIGRAHV